MDSVEVKPHRCLIVLGMHRSGTSALTGVLQQAGVYLGEVNDESPDNVKGNKESRLVMTLHNDILESNGGSWQQPPKPLRWSSLHSKFRDLYIDQHKERSLWGFKDPRTLLVLNGWLAAIPDAELVAIFRHPFLVAKSLFERNEIPIDQGLDLWLHYNRDLLWHIRNQRSVNLLEFSLDPAEFKLSISRLLAKLELSEASVDFFDSKLRNSELPDYNDARNSRDALLVYEHLQTAAGDSLSEVA